MIRYFLSHQWLAFRRSSSFGRELGITILVAVLAIFITGSIVLIAFILPKLLERFSGSGDSIVILNGLAGYYLLIEFVFRYLLQKVPAIDIEPYLTLPVKRNQISLYLIGRSLFSLFNLYPVILIMPLAVEVIAPRYGMAGAGAWVTCILCLSLSVHFLQILFKKKYDESPLVWIIIISIAGISYLLRYWIGVDLIYPFAEFMDLVASRPAFVLIPGFILAVSIWLSYRFFRTNLYLEELLPSKMNDSQGLRALDFIYRRLGTDQLMLQEVRMVFRHKRTRSLAFLSLIFVPYGLIFFGNEDYENTKSVYVFIGIFISAIFTINYGQFFWAWNTNQLDFYFTRPISLHQWIMSRYRMLVLSALISLTLCVPYVYFGWEILLLLICCCMFNIGINIPVMMRLSMWSPKPIDLSKGSIMNYQGTGAAQWIMAIPILVSPYVIFIPLNINLGFVPAVVGIGIAGLIGFMLRDYFINMLIQRLRRMKYKLIRDLIL